MKNKKILIPVIVAIVLVACIVSYRQIKGSNNSSNPQKSGPSAKQKEQEDKANADRKGEAIKDEEAPSTPAPQNTNPSTQPSSSSISLSANQETNGTVTILTNLGPISSGTCKLDITSGNKTTSLTAAVIYQTQYSSCAGFSIPVSSIGTGTWNIKLTVIQGDANASTDIVKEVT